MQLNPAAIDALKPRSGRYDIADDACPGLYLTVLPSGVRSWTARYSFRGRDRRYTIGRYPAVNVKTARKMAVDVLRSAATGTDLQQQKTEQRQRVALGLDQPDLFGTTWEKYVKRHVRPNLKRSTQREIIRIGQKHLLPMLARRDVKDISPRELKAVINKVAKTAPVGANRTQAVASAFFNWCRGEFIIKDNPAEALAKPTSEKHRKRKRVLNDMELRWCWQAADRLAFPFGRMFQLILLTGVRRAEAADAEWEEIDQVARTWTIPEHRSKNHRAHIVYISDPLLKLIESLPQKTKYLFSNRKRPPSGFSKAKARLDGYMAELARAEFEQPPLPFTVHDLRRSVASGMARLGIDLATAELALNHWSGEHGGLREVYIIQDALAVTKAAFIKWGAHVATIRKSK